MPGQGFKTASLNQYISALPFDDSFFNYYTTTQNDFTVIGHLDPVDGANSTTCPAGRVLRENGRKMFPGGAYPGVTTYMVGVYDPQSMLNGFIDPNSPAFASYSTDKPNFWPDGVDPTGEYTDLGAPVNTYGKVTVDISGSTGNTAIEAVHGDIVASNGAIVASNGQVRASKLTRISVATGGTATVLSDLGQMFLITITGNSASGGVTVSIPQAGDGALVHLVISNNTASTAGTVVVTFGSSVHNTGTLSAAAGQMYCVTFFHLGNNNAIEVSRTAALSAPF